MSSSGKINRRSKPALIFDNGSGVLKAGLASFRDPPELIPCVVGEKFFLHLILGDIVRSRKA